MGRSDGVDWQLHLKRCTFAERRLDPDAAAVHLNNLFGNGDCYLTKFPCDN